MNLDHDTALKPLGHGTFEGMVSSAWWTARGPLGGYVMAILMRALIETVADPERAPRSLTVHFLRPPQAAPIQVHAQVERSGRSLTTATGRLEQQGKLMALAFSSFSSAWPGPTFNELPMPEVPGPDPVAEAPAGLPGADRPPFLDRMVFQPRFGDSPFSLSGHSEVGGWMGIQERRELDALAIVVLADAWFPAPWPRLSALAPAPTVELTVLFRSPLPLPHSLLLGRFTSGLVRDGFFDEDGVLWAPDGTVVAQSRQLALLIGADSH